MKNPILCAGQRLFIKHEQYKKQTLSKFVSYTFRLATNGRTDELLRA